MRNKSKQDLDDIIIINFIIVRVDYNMLLMNYITMYIKKSLLGFFLVS
jgi:hypothetical protein